MVDAFHNIGHHTVKLQAFAAKGLLMDNAVQSNGFVHILLLLLLKLSVLITNLSLHGRV